MSGSGEPSTTAAFYSNEETVIKREISDSADAHTERFDDVQAVFEVDRCEKWIREKNLKKVALQFPDSLLPYSSAVASQLEDRLGQR